MMVFGIERVLRGYYREQYLLWNKNFSSITGIFLEGRKKTASLFEHRKTWEPVLINSLFERYGVKLIHLLTNFSIPTFAKLSLQYPFKYPFF